MTSLVQVEASSLGECRAAYLADVALDFVVDLLVVLQILGGLEDLAADVALELLVAVVLLQMVEQTVAGHKRFAALRIVALVASLALILMHNAMRVEMAGRGERAMAYLTGERLRAVRRKHILLLAGPNNGCPIAASTVHVPAGAVQDAVIQSQCWQEELIVVATQMLIVVGLLPKAGRAQFAVKFDLVSGAQMQLLVILELVRIVELNVAHVAVVTAAQARLMAEHMEIQLAQRLHNLATVLALEWRYIVVHEAHLIIVDVIRYEFTAHSLRIQTFALLLRVVEAQLRDSL